MSDATKAAGRRHFLVGLLTGAGAVAALSASPPTAAAKKDQASEAPRAPEPILYRRTEEVERYYRTLYR